MQEGRRRRGDLRSSIGPYATLEACLVVAQSCTGDAVRHYRKARGKDGLKREREHVRLVRSEASRRSGVEVHHRLDPIVGNEDVVDDTDLAAGSLPGLGVPCIDNLIVAARTFAPILQT